MQWYSVKFISSVDVDTQIYQYLLGFESGIGCSTRHVNRKMKDIPSILVSLIYVSTKSYQALYFFIISPDQSYLKRKNSRFADRHYICTFLSQYFCCLITLSIVQLKEWCFPLLISLIEIDPFLNKVLHFCVHFFFTMYEHPLVYSNCEWISTFEIICINWYSLVHDVPIYRWMRVPHNQV